MSRQWKVAALLAGLGLVAGGASAAAREPVVTASQIAFTSGRGGNDGGSNPLATSPRSSGVALAATSDWNLRLVLLEGGSLCGGRRVFGCCLLWLLLRSL